MAAHGWRRVFRLDSDRRHVERDVNEEIAFHLEMRMRKLVDAGMDPESARRAALAQFGDLPTVRDECLTIGRDRERAMRFRDFITAVRQDVAYAVRSLRAQPGFTAIVVLILAIGIAANTATFTVIDALMLRDLPVPHPEQLVTIGDPAATGSVWTGTPVTSVVSYPVYRDVRDNATTLTGIYANGGAGRLDLLPERAAADAEPSHPRGRIVSGNFFDVLQVPAFIGRTFDAARDDAPGAAPVVVVSYAYWANHLARDPQVVGRRLKINDAELTIIGVAARAFAGDIVGASTDMWIPIAAQAVVTPPRRNWLDDRSRSWLLLMGRVAPGATIAQARAEVSALELNSIESNADETTRRAVAENARETPVRVDDGSRGFSYYRKAYRRALFVLTAVAVLVALVVCANVANLLLARSAARARELSVRMTLGAGRRRVVQQLLTESTLLALAAAALALLFAWWGTQLLLRAASSGPAAIPLDVQLDWRVLGYTAAVALFTMILFGLAPSLRATRIDLATALRGHSRSVGGLGGGAGRLGIGKVLVIAQVALSTLLLVGTGMLIHSLQRMSVVDLGMDRNHLTQVDVGAERAGYGGERAEALMRVMAAQLARIPGVEAVTYSENGLFAGTESGTSIRIPGYEIRADSEKYVAYDAVGPGYFQAIGASMLRGRDFGSSDARGAARAAVINETAARFYFGDASPLGRTLTRNDTVFTIVGVVRDVEEQSVRDKPVRRVYFSVFQVPKPATNVTYELRVAGDPASYTKAIRDAAVGVDHRLTPDVHTVNQFVRDNTFQDRMVTRVVGFFGGLTLLLAALGLYGLMAYATQRRTGEFGLRAALGAEPSHVTRMVLRETLVLTSIGVAIGLPAGLAAARLIRTQFFGIGTVDVPSMLGAGLVLACTAAIAGYLPARRAARVGPLEALRVD
jgi:predicted permease